MSCKKCGQQFLFEEGAELCNECKAKAAKTPRIRASKAELVELIQTLVALVGRDNVDSKMIKKIGIV